MSAAAVLTLTGSLLGVLAIIGMAAAVFKMGWHRKGGGL